MSFLGDRFKRKKDDMGFMNANGTDYGFGLDKGRMSGAWAIAPLIAGLAAGISEGDIGGGLAAGAMGATGLGLNVMKHNADLDWKAGNEMGRRRGNEGSQRLFGVPADIRSDSIFADAEGQKQIFEHMQNVGTQNNLANLYPQMGVNSPSGAAGSWRSVNPQTGQAEYQPVGSEDAQMKAFVTMQDMSKFAKQHLVQPQIFDRLVKGENLTDGQGNVDPSIPQFNLKDAMANNLPTDFLLDSGGMRKDFIEAQQLQDAGPLMQKLLENKVTQSDSDTSIYGPMNNIKLKGAELELWKEREALLQMKINNKYLPKALQVEIDKRIAEIDGIIANTGNVRAQTEGIKENNKLIAPMGKVVIDEKTANTDNVRAQTGNINADTNQKNTQTGIAKDTYSGVQGGKMTYDENGNLIPNPNYKPPAKVSASNGGLTPDQKIKAIDKAINDAQYVWWNTRDLGLKNKAKKRVDQLMKEKEKLKQEKLESMIK